jgi:hypothetical protein
MAMAPDRALDARQQPGDGGFVHLTEEGQSDVPGLPVGPADILPSGSKRLDQGVEFVKHGGWRGDGHEQPHHLTRGCAGAGRPFGPFMRAVSSRF